MFAGLGGARDTECVMGDEGGGDPGGFRRHHPMQGCFNLRDIGGYGTSDGRRVRAGCVFRSDELSALTDGDLVAVAGLGIKVVFDLRHHAERLSRPNRLPADVELLERSTSPTEGAVVTLEEQIATATLPERDDPYMVSLYTTLLQHMAPDFRVIIERAAAAPERPLLFHCAAGKDRTGLMAAVLHGLLGVPDEVILDDYELSNTHYTPKRLAMVAPLLEEHGVTEDRVRFLLEARREVMVETLAAVNREWGGFGGYATSLLDLPAGLIDRLREALLD